MPRARDRGGGAFRRRRTSPPRGGSRSRRATAAALGLLLCHKPNDAPSAARTRWRIAPAPSVPDEFGGLGRTAFSLSLTRNRRGPCGTWTLTWDHHEHAFAALSLGVAEAASDRPDREALRDRLNRCVIVAPVKSALRLSAVNDAAAALGLQASACRSPTRARCIRRSRSRRPTRSADFALLEAVADWCDRYTPLVGLDPPDGLTARHLGLRASVRRRGGARARSCAAARRARPAGARRGRRNGRMCVGAWRRYWRRTTSRCGSAPATSETRSPLFPSRRCVSPPTRSRRSRRSGSSASPMCSTVRARRSRRASAHDFVRRLDQALGIEDEPITPRLPLPAALAEQRFPEPIAHERDVLGTIERLAARLGHVLEQRGEGARLLQAALFRADGKVFRVEAGTAAPLRDAGAHRAPVRGPARCDRRRMRSGLRLRHGAAVRARHRAQRSAADRPRAARSRGGSRASDRPARRALRPAPRHAAGAAGHAYSGVRRDGGGGGIDGSFRSFPRKRESRAKNWVPAFAGTSGATCTSARRCTRPHPPDPPVRAAGADRGDRRSARRSAGAVHLAARAPRRRCASKARSASPWNGGATRPGTR